MKQENKNEKNGFSPKGFTLLELTVVIAASMIILALSWDSLAKSRQDANESAACNELASYINKTRTYALTGKATDEGSVPDYFNVSTSGSDIFIKRDSKSGSLVEKYTLKNGIDCGNVDISYSVPSGDCSGSYCSTDLTCGTLGKYKVIMDRFKASCNH